jgi:hypothetical protein
MEPKKYRRSADLARGRERNGQARHDADSWEGSTSSLVVAVDVLTNRPASPGVLGSYNDFHLEAQNKLETL